MWQVFIFITPGVSSQSSIVLLSTVETTDPAGLVQPLGDFVVEIHDTTLAQLASRLPVVQIQENDQATDVGIAERRVIVSCSSFDQWSGERR